MKWVGHVTCMGERKKVYKVLVGKLEGKKALKRPRHRWEVGIKMNLREICWEDVGWIYLAQDRDQWQAVCEHVDEPSGAGNTELVNYFETVKKL
jgi:hypothetical protein